MIESSSLTSHPCKGELSLFGSFTVTQSQCISSDLEIGTDLFLVGLPVGDYSLTVRCGTASADVFFPIAQDVPIMDFGVIRPMVAESAEKVGNSSIRAFFVWASFVLSVLEVILYAFTKCH